MNNQEVEVNSPEFDNDNGDEVDTAGFKDYIFHMRDGSEQLARGFLAVAQSFVAVGRGVGDLHFVVPLDELRYVEEVEAAKGSA